MVRGFLLAGLVVATLLTGCASQPWPSTVREPAPAAHQLAVPFHPQTRYQCGPAALAMMLNDQGIGATPDALVERVYLPGRQGSLQLDMVATARQEGLLVHPLAPDFQALLSEIDAGHPVLVLQNLGLRWWPQWHYAVVTGYDVEADVLILHSGVNANYRLPRPAFLATWDRAKRWARVMLTPDQVPATTTPLAFLASAHDLEATGQLEAAREAYRTALYHWPDQAAARLGLGNVAYQQQDWDLARQHYARLTRAFPELGAGWHNLAETLEQQQCPQAASQARACAYRHDPNRFPQLPAGHQPGQDRNGCPPPPSCLPKAQ
ncbi:PA2778 family cysteine peptidase [Marinobacter xestospongiae]|uniref:PA2778 family cysteine peptidase n=1 Tax=Marinobacter xestospongiae TaxID=994319 RepID=UPI0020034EAD|nr:PA2778 family cysteine peptidase [Marinobacter xestospongiae]MCK7568129.1 PA2778 family cysteine peptidase [Marinobacter xestospongiae]